MNHPPETTASPAPVPLTERIDFVDIIRGFAVLGILIANMASYSGRSTSVTQWSTGLDRTTVNLIRFFVEAKFYSLFSFLFGWGMAVQMLRATTKGVAFIPLFIRRLIILLGFGILHGTLIWYGDILTAYACFGFCLLLFRHQAPNRLLLNVALLLFFAVALTLPGALMDTIREGYARLTDFMRVGDYPQTVYATGTVAQITQRRLQDYLNSSSWFIYYVGNVFSMFLLGLYVGRRQLFTHIHQHRPLLKRVLVLGLIVGVLFNLIFVQVTNDPSLTAAAYGRSLRVGARTIGAPALMLFYGASLILLTQNKTWYPRLRPLAAVGRMALTNYLLQSLVCTLIFYNYGLGLYNQVGPTTGLLLSLLLYGIQIRFSTWWLERYRFGPAEWVWRILTYGRWQPLQFGSTEAGRAPWPFSRLKRSRLTLLITAILLLSLAFLISWLTRRSAPTITLDPAAALVRPTVPALDARPPQPTAVIATPVVQPVAYTPSDLIHTGSLQALVNTFDTAAALAQIEALTAPAFAGRFAGSPGGQAAGDYIAHQFAQFGLQPAGENGTFFQTFPITYTELAAPPQLTLRSESGTNRAYTLYQDFSPIIYGYTGHGRSGGQVYWTQQCTPDDFAGINVTGKVVFCRSGTSREEITAASRQALAHGAAGLLLFYDPQTRPADFGNIHRAIWVPDPLPTFRVYPSLAHDLLLDSSYTITDVLNADTSFPLSTAVDLTVATQTTAPYQARNVLGVLPGRDPAHAHEVIILGGHYDHLGQSPEGTTWAGANDNASGIATLLEIARSWQAQGYVPRRTVLFAAWDAEEHGLIGSTHYVNHPRYPLTNTLAAIQLDMVGAGADILSISGEPHLAQQLHAVADSRAITATITNMGRSDHVPFLNAHVPAALLIWYDDSFIIPHYHRPADLPDVIDPQKLTAAAHIAHTTLLHLAESEPAIINLLADRTAALAQNNLAAFLATSHPHQAAADQAWFADLQQQAPTTIHLQPEDIQVMGDEATAIVTIDATLPHPDEPDQVRHIERSLPTQFSRTPAGWQWAGPHLLAAHPTASTAPETAVFHIRYPPQAATQVSGLSQAASQQYQEIAALLDLSPQTESTLMLFPDTETLSTSTLLSLHEDNAQYIEPDTIKLVYQPHISTSLQLTDALAQLLLANVGVTEEAAPWLWHGLPLALQAHANPIATHQTYLPPLYENLIAETGPPYPALDWAAVTYLQEQLGWQGLGQFIHDLGTACRQGQCGTSAGLDEALQNHLGTDAAAFLPQWQQQWRTRLHTIQTRLDTLLQTRTTAVLSHDETTFLTTLDPNVPHLTASEQHWFAALADHQLDTFSLTAVPLVLLENGDVWATVTLTYQLANRPQADEISMVRLFTADNNRYRWAGVPLETLPGDLITVRYPPQQQALAQALQADANHLYQQLATKLAMRRIEPLTIELFTQLTDFRTTISLTFPQTPGLTGWTGANAGLKLYLPDETYRPILVTQLTRQLLYQLGVTSEWLHKGIAIELSHPFDDGLTQRRTAAHFPDLYEAAGSGALPRLDQMQPDETLSATAYTLAHIQAWDAVRYLIHTQGWETLLAWLHNPTAETAVSGPSLTTFDTNWRTSLAQGHTDAPWIDIAAAFDATAAHQHVTALTAPAMAGRAAGSPGAEQAAAYIANQFAAYGLVPAGDSDHTTFWQPFPLTYTVMTAAPRLAFTSPAAETAAAYTYRDTFFLHRPALGEAGTASGELVWVQTYGDATLKGQIVLAHPQADLAHQIQQAAAHGASGLILIGHEQDEEIILARQPLLNQRPSSIPVFELTQAGYSRLLELLGYSSSDLAQLPPIHSLGLTAHMEATLTPPTPITTTNVLGLWPGTDPTLSQEVIVISAHYDHVGHDPDTLLCPITDEGLPPAHTCSRQPGYQYTGANDDASGIGVLLEIAHLWQETGYQPQRTILFAAWGAQEIGQVGSTYYVTTPTLPLENVVGLFHLDGVGGGDGFNLGIQGDWGQDGLLLQSMITAESLLAEKLTITPPTRPNDQTSFQEAGRPTLLVAWRLANEDNLPDEMANGVHPDRLGITGSMVALAVMTLAR